MFAGRSIVLVIENSNCVRAFEITISKRNTPQRNATRSPKTSPLRST